MLSNVLSRVTTNFFGEIFCVIARRAVTVYFQIGLKQFYQCNEVLNEKKIHLHHENVKRDENFIDYFPINSNDDRKGSLMSMKWSDENTHILMNKCNNLKIAAKKIIFVFFSINRNSSSRSNEMAKRSRLSSICADV